MAGTTEAAAASRTELPQLRFEKLKPGPGKSAVAVTEHQRERIQAAMLQIVVGQGYPAVTVRELAQMAGVSSRTFYELYSGKDECFLRTHDSVARRVARQVVAAQAGQLAWRVCLRVTIDTYLDQLQRDPCAAQFLLVDAYVAGSMAFDQVRQTERTFETSISKCFELMPGDLVLPPQLAKGIVVGIMCVARTRISKERKPELTRLSDELTSWAAAIFRRFQNGAGCASPFASRRAPSPGSSPAVKSDRSEWAVSDERSLIVSALIRLVASERYEELTVHKIRTSAGASMKKFSKHFHGVDDCFQEALDLYTDSIPSYFDIHQSVDSLDCLFEDPVLLLCDCVVRDPALATLGFVDVLGPATEDVRGLERFIEGIGELLANEEHGEVSASIALPLEASAAAIWGSIREEIICRRIPQLSKTAFLLRILAAVREETAMDPPWAQRCKTSTFKI